MMMKKLRLYLWWKGKIGQRKQDGKTPFVMPDTNKRNGSFGRLYDSEISEALKKKDREKEEKSQSRRRVRGGAPGGSASRADSASFQKPEPKDVNLDEIQNEADGFAQL